MGEPLRFDFMTPEQQAAAAAAAAQPAPASQGSGKPDFLVPVYEISVEGSPIADTIAHTFISCEVKQSIKLATMILLRFHNINGTIGDADTFSQGSAIEVKFGYLGALASVAKGVIVSVEPVWPQGEDPYLLVRGYGGGSTKLAQGKKTRTFLNQKVSDIVQTIAQEEGLQVECDDTSVTHDYIMQNNQSNGDFIQELAQKLHIELEVIAEEGKLRFQKPGSKGTSSGTFEWGKDLKSFYVRKNTSGVHAAVTTKGWDPAQKKAIVGKDSTLAKGATSTVAPDKVAGKFGGDGGHQTSIRPVTSTDEANAASHAAFNSAASDAQKCKGTVLGNTDVKPGSTIEIKGVGSWSGRYYVEDTIHLYHPDTGYVTEFFGKYTDPKSENKPAQPIPPIPAPADAEKAPTYVELEIVPVDGAEVVGTGYKLTLPDGRTIEGRVDETRKVRVDGIKNPGDVKVEIKPNDGHHVPGGGDGGGDAAGGS